MPTSYRRSLRKKLILLFTATASVTVLIACTTLWAYELMHYRSALLTEESAMAQLVGNSSAPALLFGDSAAATETLSLLRADWRVQMACLYDRHGNAVAHFASTSDAVSCPSAEPASSHFTRHHLIIFRPITVENDVVGQLYMDVGLAELYAMLERFAETAFCVLLMATIFALALSSVLERVISRPIIHLTEIATQVSEGSNYLLRAQRNSDDETGVLIDQFNLMMDRVQERDAELQRVHDGLEGEVKERTQDLRDEIAERKVIERDLNTAKLAAEESNRAKSDFLANMSHELRTPLNAIIGFSEILHEDSETAGLSSMSLDLDKVLLSARHLLGLISDILDLSKIEAGKMQVYPEPVLVTDILLDVMSTAVVLAKPNNNQLIQSPPIWSGVMLADPVRFRQCLLNLISNACKFTENGVISISVEQGLEEGCPWLLWTVSDTGIGISPENHASLFQTFSQIDSSATRKHGGSGLGLVISQQLCNAMGAYITVASNLGAGSAFTIHIPDQLSSPSPNPRAIRLDGAHAYLDAPCFSNK